jgi:tetratricopeptide (TPR) repeat protein
MDGYSQVFNHSIQKFQETTDKDGLFFSFRANKAIYGFIENGDKAPDKEAIDLSKAYNDRLYEHYITQLKNRNPIGYNGSSQQYAMYNELDSRHIMMSVFLFTKLPESPTTIIEIGGGYGNWFYLNRQQLFNSWVTIDLPHVCELQSWYLSQMNIDLTKWKTISTNNYSEYSNKPVDLVIGSHSLSEFSLPIFQNYFNTIVQHSNYFYYCYHMTMPTPELIQAKLDIIHKQFTVVDSFISEKGRVMNCLYKNKKDSIFYCAQSYNSCGNYEKAIEYYKKALTLNLWVQEKYVACYEIYNNYEQLNRPFEGLSYLVESYKYDKTRIEGVYRLIQYYCIQGSADIAYMYYTLIQDFFENRYDPKNLGEMLFAKKAEYEFYLPYYMIIVGERTKRHSICIKMYETIFKYKYVAPQWWMNNLLHNLQFCIPYLPQDPVFLSNLVDYIDVAFAAGKRFNSRHYEILTNIIHHYSPQFNAPCAIVPRTSNIQIILTMTTCKRFNLFEKTVKSLLSNWTDINKIDYFYCVDDNSSESDRLAMRCAFPFFDYYMKSPEERGHRESMNLIWNKLNEVKPTYWIHLEDDWLYFRKEAYVSRAIKYLTIYENKNVHQVVFNRNYGVVYGDLERNGGIRLEDGFVLHEKRGGISGKNCGYWPHYSLQPSMSRVSKILELGNYDSPNKFFERDYANKYFACEYMTGFFNSVYSIHIGKQHWETDGKNAYKLNDVSQFNSKN